MVFFRNRKQFISIVSHQGTVWKWTDRQERKDINDKRQGENKKSENMRKPSSRRSIGMGKALSTFLMTNKTGSERYTDARCPRQAKNKGEKKGGNFAIYLPGKKEKNKSRHHHRGWRSVFFKVRRTNETKDSAPQHFPFARTRPLLIHSSLSIAMKKATHCAKRTSLVLSSSPPKTVPAIRMSRGRRV